MLQYDCGQLEKFACDSGNVRGHDAGTMTAGPLRRPAGARD